MGRAKVNEKIGLTVPQDYGGAGLNTTQYARVVKVMAYAAPAYRSIFSINVGMFNSAIKNGGTNPRRSNKLMQLRVAIQFAIILMLLLAAMSMGK